MYQHIFRLHMLFIHTLHICAKTLNTHAILTYNYVH